MKKETSLQIKQTFFVVSFVSLGLKQAYYIPFLLFKLVFFFISFICLHCTLEMLKEKRNTFFIPLS